MFHHVKSAGRRLAVVTAASVLSLGTAFVLGAPPASADEGVPVPATSAEPAPPAVTAVEPELEVAPEPTYQKATAADAAVDVNSLLFSYRCGSSTSSGYVGQPVLVGNCLIETAPSTAPTTPGSFQLQVVVTPTAAFYNQVVAVGYDNYNLGFRLDGALGSPVRMILTYYPVVVTGSGLDLCAGDASAVWSVPSGASRVRSIEGSVGWGTVASWDPVAVSAPFWYGQTAAQATVEFDTCGGAPKRVALWLPSGLSGLTGRYNSYSFSLQNLPSYLSITYDDRWSGTKKLSISQTSSSLSGTVNFSPYSLSLSNIPTSMTATMNDWGSTKQVQLSHNGSYLSGSVNLASFGTASFTNAPRTFDLRLDKDGSGDLSKLTASANNAPGSGTNVYYHGVVNGITIHVDIRAISAMTIVADMANKYFTGDVWFMNRNGYSDTYVTGSWKGIGYNVELDGNGIGFMHLGAGASSPYVNLHAVTRDCYWGCGYVSAQVRANFFNNSLSIGTGFSVWRRSDGRYDVYSPLGSCTLSEGYYCWWWVLVGEIRTGAHY